MNEEEIKSDIGKKKRSRYLTVNAPEGYKIIRQQILAENPKKMRIFFEYDIPHGSERMKGDTVTATDSSTISSPSNPS